MLYEVITVINREGKVVTWNQAMERLTGIGAADMVGKGNYEYALPFYGESVITSYSIHYTKLYEGVPSSRSVTGTCGSRPSIVALKTSSRVS